jgi:hypothetical protein
MRMTLKSLTAGAFVSLATVVIIGMSNVGLADAISDTVTVKDTLGKINGDSKHQRSSGADFKVSRHSSNDNSNWC